MLTLPFEEMEFEEESAARSPYDRTKRPTGRPGLAAATTAPKERRRVPPRRSVARAFAVPVPWPAQCTCPCPVHAGPDGAVDEPPDQATADVPPGDAAAGELPFGPLEEIPFL